MAVASTVLRITQDPQDERSSEPVRPDRYVGGSRRWACSLLARSRAPRRDAAARKPRDHQGVPHASHLVAVPGVDGAFVAVVPHGHPTRPSRVGSGRVDNDATALGQRLSKGSGLRPMTPATIAFSVTQSRTPARDCVVAAPGPEAGRRSPRGRGGCPSTTGADPRRHGVSAGAGFNQAATSFNRRLTVRTLYSVHVLIASNGWCAPAKWTRAMPHPVRGSVSRGCHEAPVIDRIDPAPPGTARAPDLRERRGSSPGSTVPPARRIAHDPRTDC